MKYYHSVGKELPLQLDYELLLEHNIVFIEALTEAFPQFCFQCIIFKEFGIFYKIQIPKLFMPSLNILLCFSKRYALIKNKQDPGLLSWTNTKYCMILSIPIISFFFQMSQFSFNKYLSRPESFVPAILAHPCFALSFGWIFHKIHKMLINKHSKCIPSRIIKLPVMLYFQLILVIPAIISFSTHTLMETDDQILFREPGEDKLFFYRLFPELMKDQVNPEDCNLYDINYSKL